MNKTQALRLLVAAHDDPVLAAWAAVIDEYKASPECDVSPYEHWEAYQEFFSHGLITSTQYDGTDARRVFFSGRKPPAGEIQRVLNNLKFLPERQPQEPPVSKTKLPDNPFASSSSLVARDSGNGSLVNGHHAGELPARQAAAALNPFAGAREALPKSKDPIAMEAFAPRGNLACREPNPDRVARIGSHEIEADLRCCGERVEMIVDGGQAIGPDDLPGGQVSVIDAIFHGKCQTCNTIWHCSAGKTIPQEAFR